MAFSITRQDLEALKEKAKRAQTTVRNAKEMIAEQVGHVVRTAEVGGAAFAFGVANGYTGGVEVLGIPLDLGLGVLGHVGGFLVGGDVSNHVHSISDGAIASYATVSGIGIGAKMKERQRAAAAAPAGGSPPAAAAGALPSPNADASMAAAIRGMQQAAGVRQAA